MSGHRFTVIALDGNPVPTRATVDTIIRKATRQPLLDASRVLLRHGVDPTITIRRVRVDAPTIVTTQAPIRVAAQYDVMGEKFVKRKLAAGPMPGSGIETIQSTAPVGPSNTNPTLPSLA